MVPNLFVIAEDLPLTPNGKVDRKQLLLLDAARGQFDEGHVSPETPLEEVVCNIWSQVLNVEPVGVTANFFDLGGHSLRATQVVARIRESLGIELPVGLLFECPTVRELAERIQQRRAAGKTARPPALKPRSRDGLLQLSFAQQRLWFLDQLEPRNPAYNLSLGLRLQGSLDLGALEHAFARLVERHEVLRTRFESRSGAPVQVIPEQGELNLSVIDLSHTADAAEESEAAIRCEVAQGFDLSRGPLLRVRVLKLSDNDHLLLVVLHHIVADGWSLGLLLREIFAGYQSGVSGRADEFESLPIQYGDYAVWQREWLSDEVLAEGLQY